MSQPKPKLRMAPAPDVLAIQQAAAVEQLLKLDTWTEEPGNPPASLPGPPPAKRERKSATVGSTSIKSDLAPVPEQQPEPIKRPWEIPSPEAVHPYHIVLPERLFQKMDYVWKRQGCKSAREFVMQVIDRACNHALQELGEKP
jgi:hypothetical protein